MERIMKWEMHKRKEETKPLKMALNRIDFEVENYENLFGDRESLVKCLKDTIKELLDVTFKLMESEKSSRNNTENEEDS